MLAHTFGNAAEDTSCRNCEPPKVLGEQIAWDNGITVQTYELNDAEHSYFFPKRIICEASGFLDFWRGVDKYGKGPEKYRHNLSRFIKDVFGLGITGLYATENVMTVFINVSGEVQQTKWKSIEPKIKSLMEKYLL